MYVYGKNVMYQTLASFPEKGQGRYQYLPSEEETYRNCR